MCGIVGIFEYGRREGHVDEGLLLAMRETIQHRGPDDAGAWVSGDRRVGLAMRRLSILDLAGGGQPMFGQQGEVLVFNGEIYNYPALRRELQADGVSFRTTCDTEVVLKLYERHGTDCLRHLNGMFALALWDPARRHLFFARDRLGEKPFYWADMGGTLVFGSEIKALLEHPAVSPAVNEPAIGPYLTNLVTTAPDTLYAGIGKLPAGTMGLCGPGGIRLERYWDVFEPRRWNEVGIDEAARTVRALLDSSVHDRLLSDVPVGVLLSGGLDSTTLVALLRDQARGLATFSVGFEDHPELDEREEARRVAGQFKTDHHEVVLSEGAALEALPALIHHQDEPLADPVCLPLHAVCALARANGVPVVLAGEGSDELFWGYTNYARILQRQRWMRAIMRLPRLARRPLPALVPPHRFGKVRELLAGFADGRPLPMHMPIGFNRYDRERALRAPSSSYGRGWEPSDDGPTNGRRDVVSRLGFDTQEYEFGLRLPELLLMRIDRFSMASSVEARVPFLDPRLVEYVYRLPIEHKFNQGTGKVVLREAVRDVVPEWVRSRRKQGFGAPVASWMHTRLGSLFRSMLDDEAVRRYFDVPELERAVGREGTPGRHDLDLWPILNFALWHRYWIEGRALDDVIEPALAGRP
jgi:asparagine synthase (glutamine-hydrolysing)